MNNPYKGCRHCGTGGNRNFNKSKQRERPPKSYIEWMLVRHAIITIYDVDFSHTQTSC